MRRNLLPLTTRPSKLVLVLLLASIITTGCGSADSTQTSIQTEATSETTASTADDGPDADEAIEVIFDGATCSVPASAETTAGSRVFVFTNQSDLPVRMKVMAITDDKTYGDLLAIETENGGPGNSWAGPPWAPEALISFQTVEMDLAEDQSALRYDLVAGPHAVLAFSTRSPLAIWLCGPLTVGNAEVDAAIIDVTFDGDECRTSGPTVVPAAAQPFVLQDLTGEGRADVRTMAITDDHTYGDLLDLQGEPGEYVPLPDWAEWPLTTFESVDRELGDNELGKKLLLEPGVHGIVVGTGKGLWFCGELTVTGS